MNIEYKFRKSYGPCTAFLLMILLSPIYTYAQKQQVQVEPAFWWAGMKHPQLQLMLRGDKIGDRLVSISDPRITIDSIVSGDPSAGRLSIDMHQGEVKHIYTPDNKTSDYLFIYLNIAHTQAGKFTIFLKPKALGKSIEVPYELKKRQLAHGAQGFDSSDVVYLIMPDRFTNGDETNDRSQSVKRPDILDRKAQGDRHGGDLMGIMHRLGYLDSLGVTSLWLTPVQTNDMGRGSYHGYAITDYYRIDPRLGDNELYRTLVQQAHQRGMKVIMDAVFNHCGALHPWVTNLPFRDWINSSDSYVNTNHIKSCYYDPYTSKRDSTAFTDGWFVPSMPDLNQKNPHLATYLIQNSIWWIEYASIDGIRQDTYPYPHAPMMAEWCRRVMHEYPHFNIVGEAWESDTSGSAYWQVGSRLNTHSDSRLPSVMDFHLQSILPTATRDVTTAFSGLASVHHSLAQDYLYSDPMKVLRFIENHDTDRFLKESPTTEEDLASLKQALTIILTIPGIPQLYYGTETLMYGTKQHGDGNIRRDMPGGWHSDEANIFDAHGRSPLQNHLWDFLSTLLRWRRGNEVIAKGAMTHFVPSNGVYVYARTTATAGVLILINGTDTTKEIKLNEYNEVLQGTDTFEDVLIQKEITCSNGLISLGKRGVSVLSWKR